MTDYEKEFQNSMRINLLKQEFDKRKADKMNTEELMELAKEKVQENVTYRINCFDEYEHYAKETGSTSDYLGPGWYSLKQTATFNWRFEIDGMRVYLGMDKLFDSDMEFKRQMEIIKQNMEAIEKATTKISGIVHHFKKEIEDLNSKIFRMEYKGE
jgi:hypothetical protein